MGLEIFKNEELSVEIRTLVVNNEPYFIATDVIKALGYKDNVSNLLSRYCDGVMKRNISDNQGVTRAVSIIPEGDVYALIFGSKMPKAKVFKRWVFNEVLPSIRKHGAYMTPETLEKALTNPDFIIKLATQLKEEQSRSRELEAKIKEDKPKIDVYDRLTNTIENTKGYSMSETAKLVKFKGGGVLLAKFLRERKILMSGRGKEEKNKPYQSYINKGYFSEILNEDGKFVRVRVTEKGLTAITKYIAKWKQQS